MPPWRNGAASSSPERLAHAPGDDHGAERHVAGADPLRAGHQVRGEAVALAAEPAAEPSEAGDHLVGDEQDAALAADPLDRRPVAVGRRDRAARADHRLADERGGAVTELVERPLEVGSVVVGDLRDVADERPVAVAHRRDAGQRRPVRVRAVVRETARDDDRSLRLPLERPVAPDDLRRGVDRLAAAGAEEHCGVLDRREVGEAAGELERRLVRVVAEDVVRGERAELRRHGVGDLPATVADVANQSPAVASTYSFPAASQTRLPSPRMRTSSCPSTFPIAANGCQRRVLDVVMAAT